MAYLLQPECFLSQRHRERALQMWVTLRGLNYSSKFGGRADSAWPLHEREGERGRERGRGAQARAVRCLWDWLPVIVNLSLCSVVDVCGEREGERGRTEGVSLKHFREAHQTLDLFVFSLMSYYLPLPALFYQLFKLFSLKTSSCVLICFPLNLQMLLLQIQQ